MTKWDKMFGLEHPEAYGSVEPEDDTKHLFIVDLPEINYKMLEQICNNLKIDTTWIWRDHAKTRRQNRKENGL